MDDGERERADARFEEALEDRGARDPRDYYRKRLKALKGRDPGAYREAVTHYEERLIPSIASGEADPLEAWIEYGRLIADLAAPGRAVEVDARGRTREYSPPPGEGALILHLPHETKDRALLVGLPAEPTPAQEATYRLLVAGKQKLPDA